MPLTVRIASDLLISLVVGGGFFTMKHGFTNLREEMELIYREYDSFALYRIVYDEIDRLN